ncbi:MAG: hypothetical protein ACI3ZY_02925 [Parabacteroides sp.]
MESSAKTHLYTITYDMATQLYELYDSVTESQPVGFSQLIDQAAKIIGLSYLFE